MLKYLSSVCVWSPWSSRCFDYYLAHWQQEGGKKDSDVDIEESSPDSASTVQEPQLAKSNFAHARNSVGWSGAENWPSLFFVHSTKPTDPVKQKHGLILTEPHNCNMGHVRDKLPWVLHNSIASKCALPGANNARARDAIKLLSPKSS